MEETEKRGSTGTLRRSEKVKEGHLIHGEVLDKRRSAYTGGALGPRPSRGRFTERVEKVSVEDHRSSKVHCETYRSVVRDVIALGPLLSFLLVAFF